MRFWGNVVGYQAVWFCAIIAAARGLTWPAGLAFASFAAWQLKVSRHRAADLKLIAMSIVLGVLLDGMLAFAGWSVYATPAPALPRGGAPVWILMVWGSFALTLNESLAYLQKHLGLATIVGAAAGPAAYLGAGRGWHVVTLTAPAWRGLSALSIGWGIVLPLLVGRARQWSRPMQGARVNSSMESLS